MILDENDFLSIDSSINQEIVSVVFVYFCFFLFNSVQISIFYNIFVCFFESIVKGCTYYLLSDTIYKYDVKSIIWPTKL